MAAREEVPRFTGDLVVVIKVLRLPPRSQGVAASPWFHGYGALHKYKDHPYVRAAGYVHTPAAVTLIPGFEQAFRNFDFSDKLRVVAGGVLPWEHVVAFGRDVVDAYGKSYDVATDRGENLLVDSGFARVRGMKPLPCWGRPWPWGGLRYPMEVPLPKDMKHLFSMAPYHDLSPNAKRWTQSQKAALCEKSPQCERLTAAACPWLDDPHVNASLVRLQGQDANTSVIP